MLILSLNFCLTCASSLSVVFKISVEIKTLRSYFGFRLQTISDLKFLINKMRLWFLLWLKKANYWLCPRERTFCSWRNPTHFYLPLTVTGNCRIWATSKVIFLQTGNFFPSKWDRRSWLCFGWPRLSSGSSQFELSGAFQWIFSALFVSYYTCFCLVILKL